MPTCRTTGRWTGLLLAASIIALLINARALVPGRAALAEETTPAANSAAQEPEITSSEGTVFTGNVELKAHLDVTANLSSRCGSSSRAQSKRTWGTGPALPKSTIAAASGAHIGRTKDETDYPEYRSRDVDNWIGRSTCNIPLP